MGMIFLEIIGWVCGIKQWFMVLENLRKIMSEHNFSAQYQQAPIPPQGNILDFKHFQFFNTLPQGGRIIQSWDIGLKTGDNNDYSLSLYIFLCHKHQ